MGSPQAVSKLTTMASSRGQGVSRTMLMVLLLTALSFSHAHGVLFTRCLFSCVGEERGQYASCRSCAEYVVCEKDSPLRSAFMQCPPLTRYNETQGVCVHDLGGTCRFSGSSTSSSSWTGSSSSSSGSTNAGSSYTSWSWGSSSQSDGMTQNQQASGSQTGSGLKVPVGACLNSCVGIANGNYQSCAGCHVFATCWSGYLYDFQPCPSQLEWDDNVKACITRSRTCSSSGEFTSWVFRTSTNSGPSSSSSGSGLSSSGSAWGSSGSATNSGSSSGSGSPSPSSSSGSWSSTNTGSSTSNSGSSWSSSPSSSSGSWSSTNTGSSTSNSGSSWSSSPSSPSGSWSSTNTGSGTSNSGSSWSSSPTSSGGSASATNSGSTLNSGTSNSGSWTNTGTSSNSGSSWTNSGSAWAGTGSSSWQSGSSPSSSSSWSPSSSSNWGSSSGGSSSGSFQGSSSSGSWSPSPSSWSSSSSSSSLTPGRCVSKCSGELQGEFQSCSTCSGYVVCMGGFIVPMPCFPGLVWDDNSKSCEVTSSTCGGPQVGGTSGSSGSITGSGGSSWGSTNAGGTLSSGGSSSSNTGSTSGGSSWGSNTGSSSSGSTQSGSSSSNSWSSSSSSTSSGSWSSSSRWTSSGSSTSVSNGWCVLSCAGRQPGGYQSCTSCMTYVVCRVGGIMSVLTCPDGRLWDDNTKTCEVVSSTCTTATQWVSTGSSGGSAPPSGVAPLPSRNDTTNQTSTDVIVAPLPSRNESGNAVGIGDRGSVLTPSNSRCVSSCLGLRNGNYQACDRCDMYVTCSSGFLSLMPCPAGLFWDDNTKVCEMVSTTCGAFAITPSPPTTPSTTTTTTTTMMMMTTNQSTAATPAPTTQTPASTTSTAPKTTTTVPLPNTPAPTTATPAPTTATPAPTTATPAPTSATPAPTTPTPASTTSTPAPTTRTPAPTTATPAPTTPTPAPTTPTPAPTTPTPAPTTPTPAPTTPTPAPTTPTPAPTTPTPAPTTPTPAPTTPTPAPTTPTPAPTTPTPAPTTSTPAPTTRTPAPSAPTPGPSPAEDFSCKSDCTGLADGEYHSCQGCHMTFICMSGFGFDVECPKGMVWDARAKRCQQVSSTCRDVTATKAPEVAPAPLPPPQNMEVMPSIREVTLTFDSSFGAGSMWYEVQYRRQDQQEWTDLPQQVTATNSSKVKVTVEGLQPATDYVIRVRARNSSPSNNASAYTERTVTTMPAPPAAPANLQATPSFDNVVVSWDAGSGATSYQVQYRRQDSPQELWTSLPQLVVASGTPRVQVRLEDLLPSTAYVIRVRARNSADTNNASDYVQAMATTQQAPPPVPANMEVTPDSKAVTLTWDWTTGVTWYQVQYRRQDQQQWTDFPQQVTASGTSKVKVTVDGLQPGTAYVFRVWARNSEATNNASAFVERTFTTLAAPPQVPSNLEVTPDSKAVTLTWDASTGATWYQVQYRRQDQQQWTDFPQQVTASGTSKVKVTVDGLQPGTAYVIRVWARNSEASNNASAFVERTFTTLAAPPPVPSNPEVTSTANGFTMTWDSSTGVTWYQVQYRRQDQQVWTDFPQQVMASGTSKVTVTLDGLQSATTYVIRVRARNSETFNNASAYIERTFTTLTAPPPVPSNPEVTSTANGFTMTWDSGAGVTWYQVQYRRQDQQVWTDFPQQVMASGTSKVTVTLDGLQSATTYVIRVRARNSETFNNASAYIERTFTTLAAPPPPAPSNAQVTPDSKAVTLTWDSSMGVTWYQVQYRRQDQQAWTDFPQQVMASGTSKVTVTLTGLQAATPYVIRVRARNSEAANNASAYIERTFTTLTAPPPTPANVEAVPTADHVTLSWDSGEGATWYQVQYRRQDQQTWIDFPEQVAAIPTAKVKVTVEGLSPVTAYVIRVRARNSESTNNASPYEERSFTTLPVVPRLVCINDCHGLPDGRYHHCSNCSVFAVCQAGNLTVQKCPEGQLYDDVTQQCQMTSSTCFATVTAATVPTTTPYPCITVCDGLETGNYQSCKSCSEYIMCVYGAPFNLPCGGGTKYDDKKKTCVKQSTTCTGP